MPNVDATTTNGTSGARPLGEATTGVNVPGAPAPRSDGGRRGGKRRGEPTPRNYYDLPVLNKPVWGAPDIPGYLFLGGLAGAGAVLSAAAQLTGRRELARSTKVANAGAIGLSLFALVHDLGRRGRFLNMLRVFKVTSPMSVGSWLLAGFAPAAAGAALCELTGRAKLLGAAATAGAAALGPAVATYTAALISDTAVPAWHDGHTVMPFVFASSAVTSAAGLGLALAPVAESGPLVPLGVLAGLAEAGLTKAMEKKTGLAEKTYHEGRAG